MSTRDVLMWVQFINTMYCGLLPHLLYEHGGHLVFLDALGCSGCTNDVYEACVDRLHSLCSGLDNHSDDVMEVGSNSAVYGIHPFYIEKGYILQ